MDNLKIKLDDLDAGKLKTVPTDLKKLCYVVRKEVVKNIEFNTRNTTVNNSGKKKNRDATTLIRINQYNTGKQNLEKKMDMLIKNAWR